jgi:hypothetical protein
VSAAAHRRRMKAYELDIEALVEEIHRYLAAVDAFRAAGCHLRWRRERPMSVA